MIRGVNAVILWVAVMLCLTTSAADGGAPTKGDLILPRSAALRLETSPGHQSAPRWADDIRIGWPATVLAVNGQWLKIADEGGYTLRGTTPVSGWVRKGDVLNVNDDEVLSTYTDEIIAAERSTPRHAVSLARLYWLRGICREADTPKRGSEPRIALADYEKASCVDATLADAWLRQGRLLATLDAVGARTRWAGCFRMAHDRFARVGAPATIGQAAGARVNISRGARTMSFQPPLQYGVPEQVPVPRADEMPPNGWSPLVPPQLHFDLGCAYKALCEARWNADGAKSEASAARAEAAAARVEATAARAESDTANSKVGLAMSEAVEARAQVDVARAEADLAKAEAPRGKGAIATRQAKLKIAEAVRRAAAAEVVAKLGDAAAVRAANSVASAQAIANRADNVAANAEALANRAEAAAAMAAADYERCFDRACGFFRSAACSNPSWFRPPSAEGDLFLARVAHDIGDNVDVTDKPKGVVCSDDLIAAVELYDKSIRLNDRFDESFRGRATALRWLAISTLTRPARLPSDAALRELCLRADKSGDAQRAVIDRAYESAKIASSLGYDRNAESLEARARIEIDSAYMIGANVSLEQLAEAKQTLTEALLRSESTKHRRNLNNQIGDAETISVIVLQGLAAQADVDFGAVWRTAASMKRGVDRLSDRLISLDDKQTQQMATAFRELSKSITAAHRTIDEIGKIRAFGNEVAAGSREDLRLPRDMVDLIARAGAWKLVLKRLRDSARKVLEAKDKPCPLHAELHDSVAEWGSL